MLFEKLWEKDQRPKALENKHQNVYFYCYDNHDPDVIYIFEYYTDLKNLEANAQADWFKCHIKEITPYLKGTPEVSYATPVWIKK